ncbi:hypothetical protein AQUCO_01300880v1 [Aquilegia coerulea]|uniref:Uncharacterized protein n=1 Tax=Aquilegia coerulea TaxID=218851 RepID=A0A2G5E4G5_AQUCA|nr:hypothetical protein AQUCO_01300880v1 [Aquilegia coerulea]
MFLKALGFFYLNRKQRLCYDSGRIDNSRLNEICELHSGCGFGWFSSFIEDSRVQNFLKFGKGLVGFENVRQRFFIISCVNGDQMEIHWLSGLSLLLRITPSFVR